LFNIAIVDAMADVWKKPENETKIATPRDKKKRRTE